METLQMPDTQKISENVIRLPRGGYLVDTSVGYVQFGSPPETIKDTMMMEKGVPQVFVLPNSLFNWIKGISVSEIEFPIYYNYFFKKKKTYIICHEEQLPRIKRVLQEAIFGPVKLDISGDFDTYQCSTCIPDLRKEMNYFRNNLKFSDLVAFGIIKNRSFTFKGVKIQIDEDDNFTVSEKNSLIANVPGKIRYNATYKIGERLSEPFKPPLFGVTCLGPSHGFDPEENTSGYIIWVNHQGIMVDPPVNTTEWLVDSNVNPKFIDSIILTHCHADHDAGTFQKILEEEKVKVYTTETVIMSFLRKYSALSDVPIQYLMGLFDFNPVKIGRPIFINGGKFNMFYMLHSIPVIGFKMEFQDQTFVYSSDHNNDPEIHEKLFSEKMITEERYKELKDFPWDSRVIYHESGVPPLHTPIKYLNSLPEELQKRIVVYHIAKKDFPEETSLQLAKFGIENTLYFDTKAPMFENAYQILGVLKKVDFFQYLPIDKSQEFIDIVDVENYKKGDVIIQKDTKGDRFYIIYYGNVSVVTGGLEKNKIYGSYDYFGEVALVTEQNRAADVIAETDVVAFSIERDRFLNFIAGTEFEKILKRLAVIRNSETWNLLSTSNFFRNCTSSQKTWLESMFIPVEKNDKGVILEQGSEIAHIHIIRKGEVEVYRDGEKVAVLGKGDFIGSLNNVYNSKPAGYTFSHKDSVSLYAMERGDIKKFIERNPGLLMKIVYNF